jgi:hypothetical protein
MRTLFDGEVWVHYSQISVVSDDDLPDMTEAFAGQSNGLCGAGVPGELFLITGTHTGKVRFTVEWHDSEPPAATTDWEEVVEVPYAPTGPDVSLVQWAGEMSWPLDLGHNDWTARTGYRVSYCASGMEEARMPGTEGAPAPDRYLLRFWPVGDGAVRPDAVLRQTTATAAYWHDYARGLPPPPTPQQRAEAERRAQLERERQHEEYRQREEARKWGGRAPSERLRRVVGNVSGIAQLDRDLVDRVAEAGPDTQRRIAHWAARHAYTFAGIADLDWIAPAWAALDRGEPLPESFTDLVAMWRRIVGPDVVVYAHATLRSLDGRHDPAASLLPPGDVDPVSMALPALKAAALPDPLQAALEALWAAATAYGADAPVFLAEVRRAFPGIDPDEET